MDRKQITKASDYKDDGYKQAWGEIGHSGGQELRYTTRNFHIVPELAGLRTYPAWFRKGETEVRGQRSDCRGEKLS